MSTLVAQIKRLIFLNQGYITLDQFMAVVINHYYKNLPRIGRDFTTSPEISSIFGNAVGSWLHQQLIHAGKRDHITILELGPGNANLSYDALTMLYKLDRDANRAIKTSLILLENSAGLQEQQRTTLEPLAELYNINLSWQNSLQIKSIIDMVRLTNSHLFIIANEFFDALPIKQWIKQEGNFHEIVVTINSEGELALAINKIGSDIQYFSPNIDSTNQMKDLNFYEHSPSASYLLEEILLNTNACGCPISILIADYGYIDPPNGSTLQAVHRHKKLSNIFDHLGDADLSAHVDFHYLSSVTKRYQNFSCNIKSQKDFLANHGISTDILDNLYRSMPSVDQESEELFTSLKQTINRLTAPEEMGSLFKIMEISNPGRN